MLKHNYKVGDYIKWSMGHSTAYSIEIVTNIDEDNYVHSEIFETNMDKDYGIGVEVCYLNNKMLKYITLCNDYKIKKEVKEWLKENE